MGTELVIQEMIQDPNSREGEYGPFDIDGGSYSVKIEEVSTDEYRLISTGTFENETQQITLLLSEQANSQVPRFFSALGLMFDDVWGLQGFDISGGGNVKDKNFNGVDESPDAATVCADAGLPTSTPGVSVGSEELANHSDLVSHESHFNGSPPLGVNEDMNNFDDISELIEVLDNGSATPLPNNVSQSDFGNIPNGEDLPPPGVFVVNGSSQISGNIKGSGILIVRNQAEVNIETGELDWGSDSDVTFSGNPEFHGLVIFENAFSMTGNGAVEIFGSVLVGKTDQSRRFDINFNGRAAVNYNCQAQIYADMAASYANKDRYFQQLSVYEN
jgi:hypothetical protein